MAMHWVDWSIVVSLLAVLIAAAVYTKRYTLSVADFLAANRCAGRYLLTISGAMAGLGAITIIAGFEMYYNSGFSAEWWRLIQLFVMTVMLLSGWIVYRFRQTRALTLAQFLEMRYSKKFRVFMGIVAWLAGVINFGIFPSVGARFFIYFCGLPDSLTAYILIMLILLSIALLFTFLGGQIAVIVTDFLQGVFCNVVFVVILLYVLCVFSWPQLIDSLSIAPEKASLIHPFQTQKAEDFNIWYYLIIAFTALYVNSSWQGTQGYNASALNAHEARMGKVLGTWRLLPTSLFVMLVPLGAYTFMHCPEFASSSQAAKAIIAGIGNPQIQKQMATPIAIRFFLPAGIMGGMASMMLAAFISTHDTYLHSWGSIFIQDVVVPLKKKPLKPETHILLLRASIIGVAVFVFLFSLFFRQTDYIFMFFAITGAIFTGGAGAVVIGGLYWKRGTTTAAWCSMITGSTLALAVVLSKQLYVITPQTHKVIAFILSQNGAVLSFYASAIAILVYVVVSLLERKEAFDLDKMLHRGKYALEDTETKKTNKPVRGFRAMIGMGEEFNFKDKIIYMITVGWTCLLVLIFVFGTVYNFMFDVKTEAWGRFWHYYVWVMLVVSIITTVWFAFGGFLDLRRMFNLLGTTQRNDLDDGVVNSENEADQESCSKV